MKMVILLKNPNGMNLQLKNIKDIIERIIDSQHLYAIFKTGKIDSIATLIFEECYSDTLITEPDTEIKNITSNDNNCICYITFYYGETEKRGEFEELSFVVNGIIEECQGLENGVIRVSKILES